MAKLTKGQLEEKLAKLDDGGLDDVPGIGKQRSEPRKCIAKHVDGDRRQADGATVASLRVALAGIKTAGFGAESPAYKEIVC